MKLLLLLLTISLQILIISCDSDNAVESQNDSLSEHFSSEHFEYYYSKADTVKIDTVWQERYLNWLLDTLNVNLEGEIQFYKYRDREHLKKVTGKETNGFAEPGKLKFHSIWKIDNHECVHAVVIVTIGHPPALFNEGIAVAHQANYFKYPDFIPEWNNQDFNNLSKNYLNNQTLPSLDELTGTNTFWNYDANITYPVAGSFIRYLIDHYGIDKLKEFISKSSFYDSKDVINNNFSVTYNKSLNTIWEEWKLFINN